MLKMTMMIGLPRSGKTTYVDANRDHTVIVCADQFRQLMYGQRFYSEGEAMMWATRDIALKILLGQGVDVIIDETNITSLSRKKLIKLAKNYGYKVHGVFVDTPSEVCVRRAAATNQENLIPVIDKMTYQLEEPLVEEGFTTLTTIPYHPLESITVKVPYESLGDKLEPRI